MTDFERYQLKTFRYYRSRFKRIISVQDSDIDEDLKWMAEESERAVLRSSRYDQLDESKADSALKNVIIVGLAGFYSTLVKNSLNVSRVNGEWGEEMIAPYENPSFDSKLQKQISDLMTITKERLLYREFPADGRTIGSRIKTLEGSSLKAVRNILAVEINKGSGAKEIAGVISNYMRKDDRRLWTSPFEWYRQRFGYKRGQPKDILAGSLDYSTYRIARTEINYTWRDATVRLHDGKPYMKGWNWVLSDAHPRHDICLAGDVEILTEKGFVRFADYVDGKVAQISDNHDISFVKPTRIIRKGYRGEMYRVVLPFGNTLDMTRDHHQPLWSKRQKRWIVKPIQDTSFNNLSLVYGGKGTNKQRKLTSVQRLQIAYQADGHFLHKTRGGKMVSFHLSKKRKIKRLFDLAKKSGIKVYERKTNDFRVELPVAEKRFDKMFSLDVDYSFARDFVEEVSFWDSQRIKGGLVYCSKDRNNLNFVQAVSCLAGYRTNLVGQKWVRLSILENSVRKANSVKIEKYGFDGVVYCVTVPSGKIIVRSKEGMVVVTGNCDDWADGSPYTSASGLPEGHCHCMCSVVPVLVDPTEI